MDAERLVALEAALAELGELYTAACNFTSLRAKAEGDLLPRLTRLAAWLRALHRRGNISHAEMDLAAKQILDLRTHWHEALQSVRDSAVYRAAVAAYARGDQGELERLIPGIFAGVHAVPPPERVYFAVSAAVHRRRPGGSPFLSPDACAEKIAVAVREGLVPRAEGGHWWDDDLPWLPCTEASVDLDSPFSLELAGSELRAALFSGEEDLGYRVYARRLTGRFVPCIAEEIDDEWWQAYERPYADFREELCASLAARGIAFRAAPQRTG